MLPKCECGRDQVPGRTITERVKITDTEAYELYESARSFSLDDFKLALESIDGIETVDDPEPTNAEKLADDVTEGLHSIRAYMNPCPGKPYNASKSESEQLAEFLDSKGWTKAPGGDDD